MSQSRIQILEGDITGQQVDGIVNAANNSLLGGGGVDGAIHRAAGPALLEECRKLKGCDTGQAKITSGHGLPASHVIHTVGPIWRGGSNREDQFLADCYRNSLRLARQHAMKTIAFPSISTGAYGFPVDRAAVIAVREISQFLRTNAVPEEVRIVCFDRRTYDSYQKAFRSAQTDPQEPS